ncbi:CBS domain-containing protein [Eisenibacter elegans]|jgi:CBS domain-containing protein|uniref:CBS domain-containing protein n=1 Tax=Eisenibacter elegans TaxID=997 RepID=UPI00040FBA56|nr:CBS domain-containing protein [Eisenibacter elegans]
MNTFAVKNPEQVGYHMATKLIMFHPEQPIYEVMKSLLKHKISGAPVINSAHELVGVISEKDCLRVVTDSVYHNLPAGRVQDYMTQDNILILSPQTSIIEAAQLFLRTHVRRFPVVDKGKVVGVISRSDILRAAQGWKSNAWSDWKLASDANANSWFNIHST